METTDRPWRTTLPQAGYAFDPSPVLLPSCKEYRLTPLDVALAVSGGADSMALTVLSKNLSIKFPGSSVKVRAFVVDHAARSGSDIEAAEVAKVIKKMGTEANTVFKRALSGAMAD